MIRKLKFLILFSVSLTTLLGFIAFSSYSYANDSRINVPLRIHLVENLPMEKRGVKMINWITPSDLKNIVLPNVNHIWRDANIQFYIEGIYHNVSPEYPKKGKHIDFILNTKRNDAGKADSRRVKKLKQLIDWSNHSLSVINIYLVPYLGEGSQGIASSKKRRIYVAQWSDKASRGVLPPTPFVLSESLPFKYGSFSRTVAHEIGHVLGLKHPDKNTQRVFSLLMGGKQKGYKLTADDIASARIFARALAQ